MTHDQEDALQIADHIMILANGQLQQIGTSAELYRHPHNQTVAAFIGHPQINLLPVEKLPAKLKALLPASALAQATTLGIRSEAILPTTPDVATFSANITQQVQLGRDTQTHLHNLVGNFVSTAIAPTTATQVALTVAPQGCHLFNHAGMCLWSGDAHA